MIWPPPQRIIWCYNQEESVKDIKDTWADVEFIKGPPNREMLKQGQHQRKLVILDDLFEVYKDDEVLREMFTQGSHHWDLSVVFITQNLFFGERTNRSNTNYLVLMNNPLDKMQMINFARQMNPCRMGHFMNAYNDAISQKPLHYLFIDGAQTTDDECRLVTNVFPGESTIVYVCECTVGGKR